MLALSILALQALRPTRAAAQPAAEISASGGSTQYRAPEGCPGRDSFEQRSGESLALLRAGEQLAIDVSKSEHGFQGKVELIAADATIWSRGIAGASCDEVVSALALSLAVHVDGLGRASDELPANRLPISASAVALDDRGPEPPLEPPPTLHWRLTLDAGAGLRSGLGESFDPSLRLGLGANGRRPSGHGYRLGFELGSGAARPLPAALGEGRWQHQWWTVNAQACPWGVALTRSFGLEPCFSAHLGRYAARVNASPERAGLLAAVELGVRASLHSGSFGARLELGGFVPLDPLGMEREGQVFFRQRPGLVATLSLAYDLLAPEKQ